MAVYTKAAVSLLEKVFDFSAGGDSFEALLYMVGSSVPTELNANILADFTTLGEMDGTNYVRKSIANQVVREGVAKGEWDFDNLLWTSLGNGSAAIQGILVFRTSDNRVIAFDDFSSTVQPGGNNFETTFDDAGFVNTVPV